MKRRGARRGPGTESGGRGAGSQTGVATSGARGSISTKVDGEGVVAMFDFQCMCRDVVKWKLSGKQKSRTV